MDWNRAIEWNEKALWRILAMLVAMAGLAGDHLPFAPDGRRWPSPVSGGPAPGEPDPSALLDRPTLARHLHRAVSRLLRPAESALRRLIIVAARSLVLPAPKRREPRPKPNPIYVRDRRSTGIFVPRGVPIPGAKPRPAAPCPAFPLLDPPHRFARWRGRGRKPVPRICVPGITPLFPVAPYRPPTPYDRLDARRLVLRLDALGRALDDLPAQARRYARWRARRDAALERERQAWLADPTAIRPAREKPIRLTPIRIGRPPGSRRRGRHEVHDLVRELHRLALEVMEDTS